MKKPVPLSYVENRIFLREVMRVGIKTMEKQLNKERARDFFCLTITLKFLYSTDNDHLDAYNKNNNDELIQPIIDAITKIEQRYGFTTVRKRDAITGELLNKQAFLRGYLGAYTCYSHYVIDESHFIQCTSNFTRKEVLEKSLKDIKKTYYSSNL